MRARSEDQDQGQCKRGCCWNPHGVCPHHYGCDHHKQSVQLAIDNEIAEFARQLNIADLGGTAKWIH